LQIVFAKTAHGQTAGALLLEKTQNAPTFHIHVFPARVDIIK
jgi:hypothetical protein